LEQQLVPDSIYVAEVKVSEIAAAEDKEMLDDDKTGDDAKIW